MASATDRPAKSTVDQAELDRFGAIAAEWWDPAGKFAPLHRLNPLRLGYIRDAACARFGRDPQRAAPLEGLRALDVGCGGGLVAEPLARMGAAVTAIDAEERNIAVARTHAAETGVAVDYRTATAEDLAASGERFDLVTALEIVEHVADLTLFLGAIAALTRDDGLMVISSINRTPKAFAFAIVGAEYVLRWLPRGTHDWRKLVRPSELAAGLRPHGIALRDLTGVVYDPVAAEFRANPRDLAVNYMGWAAR